jgi:hypothetical protein
MVDFPVALEHARVWMDEVQGVEAVGECETEGEKCISVYVTLPEAAAKLPSEFEGYKVVIEQGGPIQAQEAEIER